jgi:hypothetical protein
MIGESAITKSSEPRASLVSSGQHLVAEVTQVERQEDDAEGKDAGIDDVEVHVGGIRKRGAHAVIYLGERID